MANEILTRFESEQAMVSIDRKVSSAAGLRMAPLAMVALTVALTVSGCANKDDLTTGSIPDDYRQRHPIVLAQAEHNVDLPVSEGDRRITSGMRDTIRGFAQDYKAHATGNVEILSPRGTSPTASIMARQIRQELVASGIPSPRIVNSAYPSGSAGDAGPIRLRFMATTAVTNACGQWPEDLADRPFDNQNYYNFGCAQQNNLAAQVANPTDLVSPRAQTPIDAEQRGKVINDYRTGNTPTSTIASTGFGG
jgi:pilus assembly protein CpaD